MVENLTAAGVVLALQEHSDAPGSVRERLGPCEEVLEIRMGSLFKVAHHHRRVFETYLARHDRITTWDMVDRAAPWVVGRFLTGRPKEPLHELAHAAEPISYGPGA